MGADLTESAMFSVRQPPPNRHLTSAKTLRAVRASELHQDHEHRLAASVHKELLRVDLVRADVVSAAISRSGTFDESPTFAVCVNRWARARSPRSSRLTARGRPTTSDPDVSLGLDPSDSACTSWLSVDREHGEDRP